MGFDNLTVPQFISNFQSWPFYEFYKKDIIDYLVKKDFSGQDLSGLYFCFDNTEYLFEYEGIVAIIEKIVTYIPRVSISIKLFVKYLDIFEKVNVNSSIKVYFEHPEVMDDIFNCSKEDFERFLKIMKRLWRMDSIINFMKDERFPIEYKNMEIVYAICCLHPSLCCYMSPLQFHRYVKEHKNNAKYLLINEYIRQYPEIYEKALLSYFNSPSLRGVSVNLVERYEISDNILNRLNKRQVINLLRVMDSRKANFKFNLEILKNRFIMLSIHDVSLIEEYMPVFKRLEELKSKENN